MLDHPNGNGHSNGIGLVVEDLQNLTFQVNRKVFVSPEILEDENRTIFDHCWIYVGHASELEEPGDFKTRHVAGRPVIFCRDRKGEVRALSTPAAIAARWCAASAKATRGSSTASITAGPTTPTAR